MVDLRLYALLDPERAGGHDLAELGRKVVAGGATLVQLRDKHGSTRRMIDETRAIKAALTSAGVPLLVNDRVDVALAAGADGVHVGQDDMPVAEARRLLGPSAVIGLSVKTLGEAEAAPLDALDYVCVGGVFVTTSKDNVKAPIGITGMKELLATFRARAPKFPVGAIAGIDETNAGEVVSAGADGVAVISALSLAPDPTGAARRLRGIVDESLRARGSP
ncbi:MAG TPA: thiamine phosphate synthase [Xanthobacteraceae bacterium]|jgi:thiamine-phosphate pyrophosphorylase|nr:thiamine phosphate synthase [Xanthobacteraceae bacterium]